MERLGDTVSSLVHDAAGIDIDRLAGDARRKRVHEKERDARDFVFRHHPLHRGGGGKVAFHLIIRLLGGFGAGLNHALDAVAFNGAGTDAIDADAFAAPFRASVWVNPIIAHFDAAYGDRNG